MVHALEVDPTVLIERAAKQLASESLVEPTEWSKFVKTGTHKDRHPMRTDWWFVRSAAILRSVYHKGPVGTNKLRTKYGGSKRRGYKPNHFYKGSGSIIRNILQQLESSGLVKQEAKGVHKGRVVTPKGRSFLDKIAVQLKKEMPKPELPKKKVVKAKKEGKKVSVKKSEVKEKKLEVERKVEEKPVETEVEEVSKEKTEEAKE